MKPGLFALPGHMWFPKGFLKGCGKMDVVRTSTSGKSVLVRMPEGENVSAAQDKRDSLDVYVHTHGGLAILFHRAEKGDTQAANRLAELLRESGSRFTKLCKERPELFRTSAERSWAWPVMMSLHPLICGDEKARRAMLEKLSLGKEVPIEVHPSARWKPDTAGDIAFSLLSFIWFARSENRSPHLDYGRFGEAADALPPFNADTTETWWKAGLGVLLFSYPRPEVVRELNALVTSPSKRKSPGRIKRAIIDLIKARFLSLAKPNLT